MNDDKTNVVNTTNDEWDDWFPDNPNQIIRL